MDLNFLYSEHQQSLMRAMVSTSFVRRSRHLASAGSVARRIEAYQLCKGAAAAAGWTGQTEDAELADNSDSRTSV